MGGTSSNTFNLSVATLNYAGITHSPFEFYSGNSEQRKQLQQLSTIFRELIRQDEENKGKIDLKNLKKLDKIMQRQRYCPLYRQDAGVIHGRLLTRQKFQSKWQEQYDKNSHYVKFTKEPNYEQILTCKRYDFLVYKTFVEFVYLKQMKVSHANYTLEDRDPDNQGRKNKQERQKRKKIASAYQQFLAKYFSKDFLKHSTKLQAVKKILEEKDIVFLQDVSDELINSLKNEGLVNIINYPSRECVVLVKQNRQKFKNLYDQRKIFEFYKQTRQNNQMDLFERNFYYDGTKPGASVCFLDNFILVSMHLSSAKNEDQWPSVLKFMKHMLKLTDDFPSLVIVGGGDFNRMIHYAQTKEKFDRKTAQQFFQKFYFYPSKNEIHLATTRKKRTYLQSQWNKADKEDSSCRDFLFSNRPFKQHSIVVGGKTMSGDQTDLLSKHHPFDHYIVSGMLEIEKLDKFKGV